MLRIRPGWAALTAALAWLALILQFYLMLANASEYGVTAIEAVVNFFSFFTILSNLLVALTLTFSLMTPTSRLARFFSSPSVVSAVTVYIVIVGVTYSLLLRHIWNPKGPQKFADVLLHDLVPVLYAVYWLLFVSKTELRWVQPFRWLIFPGVYLVYSLLRGALSNRYPYPFIDVAEIGYRGALLNVCFLFVAFLVLGLLLVSISRIIPRPSWNPDDKLTV